MYRRPRVMLSWRSYAIGSFATLTVALGLGAAREGVNLSVESIADDVLTNPVKIIVRLYNIFHEQYVSSIQHLAYLFARVCAAIVVVISS